MDLQELFSEAMEATRAAERARVNDNACGTDHDRRVLEAALLREYKAEEAMKKAFTKLGERDKVAFELLHTSQKAAKVFCESK